MRIDRHLARLIACSLQFAFCLSTDRFVGLSASGYFALERSRGRVHRHVRLESGLGVERRNAVFDLAFERFGQRAAL